MKGILNPLFQAEYFISQTFLAQKKQQSDFASLLPDEVQNIINKHNSDLGILDFGTIKVQTVINILYRIIRDFCEQYPKSLRLMLFKAYFELFVMRKKYLAHQTLTRMQGEDTLGLLSYTQFQLDQQYLVEKAQILYQTKEDQLIDVDKIIQQNYHYQHFYDLNEETAFQLNIFWGQLSNIKNVDIEKLFETGVKTSELIKQTKDKFQSLVNLGIDKRNSNLYYMHANFNKYVLNSNDQYTEYMFKMKQIQSMNKTLQDNQYKDQLISDVDKSGFLLVRGTYSEFGKVIYANRQLCHLLGYTPDQLNTNGKTINVLMPQIISDHHSAFLQIFRESGIPVFIQRIQQLFMKDANGYIQPFKVYIKFHYDKEYGHVFCAIVNRTKHFYPFKNKKMLKCDEIMTIMTDELGTICEVSPSVTHYLGIPIKFVQQNQMFLQDNVKIWHMIKVDPQVLENSTSKEVFTTLNTEFSSDSDSGKPVFAAQHALQALAQQRQCYHQEGAQHMNTNSQTKSQIKSQIEALLANSQLQVDVKVKMAKVCHKDMLIVRYFFIELQDNDHFFNDQGGLMSTKNGVKQNMMVQNRLLKTIEDARNEQSVLNTQEIEEEQEQQIQMKNQKRLFEDNSSTNSDSVSKFADLIEKDIDQLIRNDTRTPKILKQILWLVLFAFLTATIISAIIMALFVHDSEQTKDRLQILTTSLQRGIYSAQVMSLLRSLIDNRLGIEGDLRASTVIWRGISNIQGGSEFSMQKFVSDEITLKLDQLKYTQQILEGNQGKNQSADTLLISFLNAQGRIEIQEQPSNVAINVIVSNIIDIVSNIDQLGIVRALPNISYSDYYTYYNQIRRANLTQTQAFAVLEIQKQIFFVFENYVKVLDQFNQESSLYYLQKGQEPLSPANIQQFLILICIGIGTIFIVLLLVSPVTFKIRKQKYQVLLFFMRLDEHIIKQSCLKSTIFEDKFSSDQFVKGGSGGKDDDDKSSILHIGGGAQGSDHDDENSSQDYYVDNDMNQANGQVEEDDFSEDMLIFNDEDESNYNGTTQEEVRRKKAEIAKRIENKINAIKARKLKEQAKLKDKNLHSIPTKYNLSDFTSGTYVNEFDKDFSSKDEDDLMDDSRRNFNVDGNRTPQIQNAKSEQRPKKNHSDFIKPDLLDSAKRLQYKIGQDSSMMKMRGQKARQSLNSKRDLPVIAEEENTLTSGVLNTQEAALKPKSNKPNLSVKEIRIQIPDKNTHSEESSNNNNQDIHEDFQEPSNKEEEIRVREEIEKKIQSISSTSQSTVLVAMLVLFLLISGYFVGIYIYTRVSIQDYRQSFSELHQIHERGVCLTKLMFYAREDMLSATEAQLGGNYRNDDNIVQGYQSLSMDQLWRCMDLEEQYTDIKRNDKGYLRNVIQIINDSDSSKLCTLAEKYSRHNITEELCKQIQNQVLTKGISLAYQDFIKSNLIHMLDYFSRISMQTEGTKNQFISQKLRQQPFLEYLYANEFLLSQVNFQINIQAQESINKYIELVQSIQISLFSVLVVLLVLITIYFFCSLFNRMKKDMLSSHTMIGMLPKHLLQKKDQLKIRDFLNS